MSSLGRIESNFESFQESVLSDLNVFINRIDNEISQIEKQLDVKTDFRSDFEKISQMDSKHQRDIYFNRNGNRRTNKNNSGH